ncbi:hypothetical protein [Erwinia oleae]|uniref:hypothetical protein n=1 Tax=Erwinia oleae TaxID=796334 RepID=UPI0005578ED5|nr:hypothetical protein [Erwinia oleae]
MSDSLTYIYVIIYSVSCELFGEADTGKLMGCVIVTRNGDAIAGGAQEDVIIIGRVTLMIQTMLDDKWPVIQVCQICAGIVTQKG